MASKVTDERDIRAAIAEKYQSLDEPRFDFVTDALDERPYAAVVRSLSKISNVEQDTDTNDDVSFGYLLSDGREQLFLQLSMVGPYATLRRLPADGTAILLDPGRSALTAYERSVVETLQQAAVTVLGEIALSRSIDLKLFNTATNRVKIYQALFSDIEDLPWSGVAP